MLERSAKNSLPCFHDIEGTGIKLVELNDGVKTKWSLAIGRWGLLTEDEWFENKKDATTVINDMKLVERYVNIAFNLMFDAKMKTNEDKKNK